MLIRVLSKINMTTWLLTMKNMGLIIRMIQHGIVLGIFVLILTSRKRLLLLML